MTITELKTEELDTQFEKFLYQYKHKEVLTSRAIANLLSDIDVYRKFFMNSNSNKSIYLLSILNSFQDSIIKKKRWINYKKFFILCSTKFFYQFKLSSKSIVFINYALRLEIPFKEKWCIYYYLIFFLRSQKNYKLASSYTFILLYFCNDDKLYDKLLKVLHNLDADTKIANHDDINVKLVKNEKQTLTTVLSTIKDFI